MLTVSLREEIDYLLIKLVAVDAIAERIGDLELLSEVAHNLQVDRNEH